MQAPPPSNEPPSPGGFTAFPPPPGGAPPPPPPPAPAYGYASQSYAGYAPQGYIPQGYVQVEYGGFWLRVVAYLIDAFILNLIAFAFAFVLGILTGLADPNGNATQSDQLIVYVLALLINLAYFAWRWSISEATIGQKVMGLRVVDANTLQPIGLGAAVLRWVAMLISFLVCYLGVVWVAFDGRKQGWHDKMASTVVIKG